MPKAQVPTEKAAPRTVRKRTQSLSNVRFAVAGGDSVAQIAHEVQSQERADREKLLSEIKKVDGNILVRIPVRTAVALKADLTIPWSKLRELRR